MLDVHDYRHCPDWMHIRTYVYLARTSPRTLLATIDPAHRERSNRNTRPVNPTGMIRQRFPQKFPTGNKSCLCGVQTVRGDDVAYWGNAPSFGHAVCRVAEWVARHDRIEQKRRQDARYARNRRTR